MLQLDAFFFHFEASLSQVTLRADARGVLRKLESRAPSNRPSNPSSFAQRNQLRSSFVFFK
jgi:hypothetical protein